MPFGCGYTKTIFQPTKNNEMDMKIHDFYCFWYIVSGCSSDQAAKVLEPHGATMNSSPREWRFVARGPIISLAEHVRPKKILWKWAFATPPGANPAYLLMHTSQKPGVWSLLVTGHGHLPFSGNFVNHSPCLVPNQDQISWQFNQRFYGRSFHVISIILIW